MDKKLFSDPRWYDNPMPKDSECNFCIYDHGWGKCDKYPDGRSRELEKMSFPGTRFYNKDFCKFKKLSK